ncbi:NAD(P)H-dependent oxidoreductase [Sediminivirga luteola]|uniref:Ribosyldihydronicotinamide dehydrogenase n=1 Tax=Sediminivirga luteola TaxID=1774748 RepID=A0A8J2TVE8_9MICO|nr:NAD(P)H-dependent oxidoreductase [Sediminivirga luteola]MCI2265884.1 NAD(P)H-dependent oxidoreductase [Sediminivirga luteola]GGA04066.1 ribosyldihydronicotinamide dehydrogenase [Sediminivirga luteola]
MITHTPEPGRALWIYAHPRRTSLNGHLLDAGAAALSKRYDVTVSDLYGEGFDPVLAERDLGRAAPDPGSIVELAGEAYRKGEIPEDVRREQGRLAAAELLILQFPLWWYGPPAILKGWFDRVLTNGFAYGDLDPERGVPRRYGDGGLRGRKALVVVTAGEDAGSIGPRGISGDIDSVLFPLTHGTLWYVGIDVPRLHVVHDADGLGDTGVERETDRLLQRLEGLDAEAPLPYRRLRDGEYRGTRALREDLLPGRTDLGIHLREE